MKTAFVGVNLALVALLHPSLPLVRFFREMQGSPDSVLEIMRNDGTAHSSEPLEAALRRAASLPGAGLRGDVLIFAAMHGTIRLWDELDNAGFRDSSKPLLEFGRHLRNACAHGNRWSFRGREPRYLAEFRGRRLYASLHGQTAFFDWLGPGDYLDYLDDLAQLLRTTPSGT